MNRKINPSHMKNRHQIFLDSILLALITLALMPAALVWQLSVRSSLGDFPFLVRLHSEMKTLINRIEIKRFLEVQRLQFSPLIF